MHSARAAWRCTSPTIRGWPQFGNLAAEVHHEEGTGAASPAEILEREANAWLRDPYQVAQNIQMVV